jgi:hypothetical protein
MFFFKCKNKSGEKHALTTAKHFPLPQKMMLNQLGGIK